MVAIISLPQETFIPYAKAKTYILIFEGGSSTQTVWFFNIANDGFSLDERRIPTLENDIPMLINSWEEKPETEKSWHISYEDIVLHDYNLSPWRYRPPGVPTKGISLDEANTYLENLKATLSKLDGLVKDIELEEVLVRAEKAPLSELLEPVSRPVPTEKGKAYKTVGVRLYGKGVFSHGGKPVKAKTLNQIKSGNFIYSKLFAWKGAFDIVGEEFDGCFASNEFPTFRLKKNRWGVDLEFVKFFFCIPSSWANAEQLSKGTAKLSRNRLSPKDFLSMEIPIPPKKERDKIVSALSLIEKVTKNLSKSGTTAFDLFDGVVANYFSNIQ